VVYSIAQGPDGVVWFGTNRGVTAYDGQTWRSFPSGPHKEHVYTLAIDPDGAVWAGAKGAVLRLTPAK
jgi:ligand-binding sensor domain-containing protein